MSSSGVHVIPSSGITAWVSSDMRPQDLMVQHCDLHTLWLVNLKDDVALLINEAYVVPNYVQQLLCPKRGKQYR